MTRSLSILGAGVVLALALSDAALAGTVIRGVPGPIAGAGLPVALLAIGYAAWRKRKAGRG